MNEFKFLYFTIFSKRVIAFDHVSTQSFSRVVEAFPEI